MKNLLLILALSFSAMAHASTPTNTITPSNTPSNTPTGTFTSTITPSATPTSTATPSSTITPSITQTSTSTATPSVTQTNTGTPTFTRTITQTFTNTATSTVTPTNTVTSTLTVTATPVQTTTIPHVVLFQANGTPVPVAATFKSFSAQSVSGASTVWTPASGARPRLLGFSLAGSVVGDYKLSNGTFTYIWAEGTAGSTVISPSLGNGVGSSVTNTIWTLQGPVAATTPCTASGTVFGTEETP